MKKYFCFLLLLIPFTANCQKESFFISVGKPWFPDKDSNSGNFSVGLNYQNNFSGFFTYGFFLEYAQSNDFPDFIDTPLQLNDYLSSQFYDDIFLYSQWSKVQNYIVGSRVSCLLINKNRLTFSFDLGFGFLFSKSALHFVNHWRYEENTGQVTYYESSISSDKMSTPFYSLGFQLHYTVHKKYFVGINPHFFMPIDEKHVNTIPVYPNYYNITLNIGKKF